MNHEDALNLILANSCQQEPDADGTKNFWITMHCNSVHVKAQLLTNTEPFKYRIVSIDFKYE